MSQRLRTIDFDYALPKELIAQRPAERRDASRLLIVRRDSDAVEHHVFADVVQEFGPNDLLVLNNTKVIPARLMGKRYTGGKVEVLLVEAQDGEWRRWSALVKTRGKLLPGETIALDDRAAVRAVQRLGGMEWEVELVADEPPLALLDRIGLPPLPPYIAQDPADLQRRGEDMARYQTVYAAKAGAIAAPTAGLHFTDDVLAAIRTRGAQIAHVTLHVGLGTFLPVKSEFLDEHPMHAERYEVSADAAGAICAALDAGRRIVAVGTTSCRVLESVDWGSATEGAEGETDIFIYPPYEFRCVGALLTNFHLPKSTLLALVSAFAGRERVIAAYAAAIESGYRFYSYGDAMLIV